MAESKRRAHRTKSGFGDFAPPSTTPFPKGAKMTAAEILAFFPNTIYRAEVIYRMIANGGTRRSIWAIVNTHRGLDAEWSANCCGEAMYKTMQKAGYTDWTIKKHDLWHDSRKDSWDRMSLVVDGLQMAQVMPARDLSFKDLATDVRTVPQGGDALDLTRVVRYCVENLDDGWRYPDDYNELLDLLGGPAELRDENTDAAVFRRWEDKKPPPPLQDRMQSPHGIELHDTWKRPNRRNRVIRRVLNSTKPPTDTAPERKPFNRKRVAETDRLKHAEDAAEIDYMAIVDADTRCGTPYARRPAEYVKPPPRTAQAPNTAILAQTFQAEGDSIESNPYSAYAFGGPRRTPPYRCLHQIAQPHPWDIGGWAENLRWAFEQRVLFAQNFPEAMDWIESPDHMACIEHERTKRIWASDELLEQMLEED